MTDDTNELREQLRKALYDVDAEAYAEVLIAEFAALAERVDYLSRSRPLRCYDCERRYEKGPDLVVSYEDWKRIAPNEGGGGVLCPNCMHDRFVALGVPAGSVRARFRSGPFAEDDEPQPRAEGERCGECRGRGLYGAEMTCPHCGGTGRKPPAEVSAQPADAAETFSGQSLDPEVRLRAERDSLRTELDVAREELSDTVSELHWFLGKARERDLLETRPP